jgi:hypothetical protein
VLTLVEFTQPSDADTWSDIHGMLTDPFKVGKLGESGVEMANSARTNNEPTYRN